MQLHFGSHGSSAGPGSLCSRVPRRMDASEEAIPHHRQGRARHSRPQVRSLLTHNWFPAANRKGALSPRRLIFTKVRELLAP
jgi:hypothetical protein